MADQACLPPYQTRQALKMVGWVTETNQKNRELRSALTKRRLEGSNSIPESHDDTNPPTASWTPSIHSGEVVDLRPANVMHLALSDKQRGKLPARDVEDYDDDDDDDVPVLAQLVDMMESTHTKDTPRRSRTLHSENTDSSSTCSKPSQNQWPSIPASHDPKSPDYDPTCIFRKINWNPADQLPRTLVVSPGPQNEPPQQIQPPPFSLLPTAVATSSTNTSPSTKHTSLFTQPSSRSSENTTTPPPSRRNSENLRMAQTNMFHFFHPNQHHLHRPRQSDGWTLPTAVSALHSAHSRLHHLFAHESDELLHLFIVTYPSFLSSHRPSTRSPAIITALLKAHGKLSEALRALTRALGEAHVGSRIPFDEVEGFLKDPDRLGGIVSEGRCIWFEVIISEVKREERQKKSGSGGMGRVGRVERRRQVLQGLEGRMATLVSRMEAARAWCRALEGRVRRG